MIHTFAKLPAANVFGHDSNYSMRDVSIQQFVKRLKCSLCLSEDANSPSECRLLCK